MYVLYELIQLLPPSFHPTFSNKLNEFFFLLKEKRFTEEEVMARFLSEKQSKNYFNKLKGKLKKELLNSILISPSVWADTSQKELYDTCYKEFTGYKILLASGGRKTAIQLTRNLLKKTRRLEFYEFVYMIASDLEFHYSTMEISPLKAKRFANMANKYLDLIRAERLVRIHYCRTTHLYNTKSKYSLTELEEFKEAEKNVRPLLDLKSGKLNRLIYNIIVFRYYAEQDYDQVLYYCEEALASFKKDHPNLAAFRFAFLNKKVIALVANKNYEEAKSLAKELGKMMPVGKYNWHLTLVQRIIICFYAGDHQEAYELYKAQMKYDCPHQLLAEYWSIIKGYLYFLISI